MTGFCFLLPAGVSFVSADAAVATSQIAADEVNVISNTLSMWLKRVLILLADYWYSYLYRRLSLRIHF